MSELQEYYQKILNKTEITGKVDLPGRGFMDLKPCDIPEVFVYIYKKGQESDMTFFHLLSPFCLDFFFVFYLPTDAINNLLKSTPILPTEAEEKKLFMFGKLSKSKSSDFELQFRDDHIWIQEKNNAEVFLKITYKTMASYTDHTKKKCN